MGEADLAAAASAILHVEVHADQARLQTHSCQIQLADEGVWHARLEAECQHSGTGCPAASASTQRPGLHTPAAGTPAACSSSSTQNDATALQAESRPTCTNSGEELQDQQG